MKIYSHAVDGPPEVKRPFVAFSQRHKDYGHRAGGLASIYPILESDLMLHEGASKSSSYERIEGLGNVVVSHTPLGKGDVLFLISNSGRNCAIIDAALEAKKRGAITVAITSMNHTTAVWNRPPWRPLAQNSMTTPSR